MECPRCGGTLTRYRLDERETVGCGSCEYVGVSVDHTAPNERPESWDDAIDRFQEQGQSVTIIRRDDTTPIPEGEPPAEVVEVDDEEVLPVFAEAEVVDADDELAEDDDWVVPVFAEAAHEETADAGPHIESADAGD